MHHLTIDRRQRENLLNQNAKVFWFTGLSGSGKSTIAIALEKELYARGFHCYLLDGDNIRAGLCSNLGFTAEDRRENIRRISETSKLFIDAGVICINAFVSPTVEIRQMAKDIIGEEDFIEVYVNTPLEVCEARDVKGLYKKARAGEIKNFTGIDAPYEAPLNPQIEIKTVAQNIEEACQLIINQLFNQ
ncbi:MAG: adenylyl-sulfate kinase [Saprospiraceae bacterium]